MTKLTAFLLWPAVAIAWAQAPIPTPPPAAAPVPQTEPVEGTASPGSSAPGTSKDRLFFALPNFLTLENADKVPPMTVKEKFKVTLRSSFDPVEYFWYGALAGISQAENSEPGFGQGAEGYAKRYGAYFADGTMENIITSAMLPSLLHQDPRYFQMGKGGFVRRAGYAVSRIFITRADSGRHQFNFSEIFGSAMSAGIATYSYHPRSDHNLPNALSVWGTQVGYDSVTYAIREFWPDIRRKMHHPKPAPAPSSSVP